MNCCYWPPFCFAARPLFLVEAPSHPEKSGVATKHDDDKSPKF